MNHRLVSVPLLATLLLAAAACRKKEPVQPVPPGLLDGTGNPLVAAPKVEAPTARAEQPEAPTVYDFEQPAPSDPSALSAKLAPTGLSPGGALGTIGPVDAGGPARDLSAELSAALSPLSSCVDVGQAAALPDGRLPITVSAYLQATGRVSRATVTAPGQPASAIGCMEKQVTALALPGSIANAPTQVSGSTQLQIRAAGANTGLPTPSASPIAPQPTSADTAQPEPGETAGPP